MYRIERKARYVYLVVRVVDGMTVAQFPKYADCAQYIQNVADYPYFAQYEPPIRA